MAAELFQKLKDLLLTVGTLMNAPGAKLLTAYKTTINNSMVSEQGLWRETKDPDTDLYPVRDDDSRRTNLLQLVAALPKISDLDLRLAQRLSHSWDTPENAASFNADTTYDMLRRETSSLFVKGAQAPDGVAKTCNLDALSQLVSLLQRLSHWKKIQP